MIKNKIAIKLSVYFAICLIAFSLIIGMVFINLFRNYTIELNKNDLQKRAESISQTFSEFISGEKNVGQGMRGGYGAYMRFIEDIAMTDVWVVDKDLNLITNGQGTHTQLTYTDLPKNADVVISEVFKGKTSFSESFSSVLDKPTLTIGTPIKSADGNIVAVVLLHSPVEGTNTAVANGMTTLGVSIAIALCASGLLSVGFSLTFTKPLNKMKNTALLLSDGDYTVKTNIKQNDEIGELATTMDILTERLYEASKQSDKLEQLRRDFIANISHELKTPVTVIRGSLEALYDEVVTDPIQVKEYYSQMLNESKGLQRLIGELLDLSRLQNNDFAIDIQPISLNDVIDDITRSGKRLADKKGVVIEVQRDSCKDTVMGDYNRIRQMLMIVLDNAIKFSKENSIVKITMSMIEDKTVITIYDNGDGISKNDLPYIFDRFYKTKSFQNQDGTGLGLAIAKQIATRHSIVISVNSQEMMGSEFSFHFPNAKIDSI